MDDVWIMSTMISEDERRPFAAVGSIGMRTFGTRLRSLVTGR